MFITTGSTRGCVLKVKEKSSLLPDQVNLVSDESPSLTYCLSVYSSLGLSGWSVSHFGSGLSGLLGTGQIPLCSCKIFPTEEIILNPAPYTNTHIPLEPWEAVERELFADLWRLWDCPSRGEGKITPFRHTKAKRLQHQQTCTPTTVKRSCLCTRKMILNENRDPHKGMKRARNGNSMDKYKDAFLIQNSFKIIDCLKEK